MSLTPRQIELCPDIRECSDLCIILENRFGKKYIESYELTNIFMKGNYFWGKFRPVHAAIGHDEINQDQRVSYAYNNYCELVCLSGFDSKFTRIYSSYAYSRLDFVTKDKFRKVWSVGQTNTQELLESVEKVTRLKVKIDSSDGYTYIVPLHTVEAYKDGSGFVAYSEYDGYPEFIRQMGQHEELHDSFSKVLETIKDESYPHTGFLSDRPFFTSHFVISENSVKHKFIQDGVLRFNEVPVEQASIYAQIP